MDIVKKTLEKDESDDDFHYEEVFLEDENNLTDGEEDLEATVRAIEASAAASRVTTTSSTHSPEAVDDFLRSFLCQMGMTGTLDCFQTEWTEMVQRGLVETERVGVVPGVYTGNRRLERELRKAQREREEHRQTGKDASDALQRVQKLRDLYKMQHNRVMQEKNRLVEEMRKLKVQCDSYEPEVKKMTEKHKAVLKSLETMQGSLERDEMRSAQHSIGLPNSENSGGKDAFKTTGGTGLIGSTHQILQPRPPSTAKPRGSPRKVKIK